MYLAELETSTAEPELYMSPPNYLSYIIIFLKSCDSLYVDMLRACKDSISK